MAKTKQKGILEKIGLKKAKEPVEAVEETASVEDGGNTPAKIHVPKLKRHSSFGDILAINKETARKRKMKFADK